MHVFIIIAVILSCEIVCIDLKGAPPSLTVVVLDKTVRLDASSRSLEVDRRRTRLVWDKHGRKRKCSTLFLAYFSSNDPIKFANWPLLQALLQQLYCHTQVELSRNPNHDNLRIASFMDASLETIGARCHTCHRQDFLPFTCPHCSHPFCIAHSSPSDHACTAVSAQPSNNEHNSTAEQPAPVKKLQSLKELQAQHLQSQHQQQRARLAPGPKANKQSISSGAQAALSAFRSLKPTGFLNSSSRSSIGNTMVELGKLKKEAMGDTTIPVPMRLYMTIQQQSTTASRKVPYYVHKNWTCGRSLDAIAKKLDVPNENNKTLDELRKLHLWSSGLVLAPTQVIGKLVKDGSSVVIYRGIERPSI